MLKLPGSGTRIGLEPLQHEPASKNRLDQQAGWKIIQASLHLPGPPYEGGESALNQGALSTANQRDAASTGKLSYNEWCEQACAIPGLLYQVGEMVFMLRVSTKSPFNRQAA